MVNHPNRNRRYFAVLRATEYATLCNVIAYTLDRSDDGRPLTFRSRAAARAYAARHLRDTQLITPSGCYDLRPGSIIV